VGKQGSKQAPLPRLPREPHPLQAARCRRRWLHRQLPRTGLQAFRPAALILRAILPGNKWTPSRDHYPTLKSDGGRFVADNVRLSHSWCNKRDWGWRAQVRTQLAKGKSLADIAEFLNRKGVPPAHGTNQWTAAMVRKAYVS
jgi:hypothetical protein